MMTRIAPLNIAGQFFDLAVGSRGEGSKAGPFAVLARAGTDIYDRPVAVEVDLESEIQVIGNVAMVEALLLLLAEEISSRERETEELSAKLAAALAAARRSEA